VFGPVRTVDFRAQLSQRVVDVPAVLRWRASGADADAARLAATATGHAAAERGAAAYVDVQRAEARIAARTADSALAAELLDMARQQLAAGVAIALDVTRAESQFADARARLIARRGDRDRALLALRRELSLPFDAPLDVDPALDAPGAPETPPDAEALVREALERRPDVRSALAGYEGARTQARAARAERLPTVALVADRGTTGRNTDRLLGTYSYGVQVTMPLFDGLRLEARGAEERARQAEAEAGVRDSRLRVETEVRTALLRVATAREEVAATRVRLDLAEREVAQSRERFRAGLSGNGDVIAASIALNGARDLAIDALAELTAARVALASARGLTTMLP
jgi:outer membrane protein